MLKVLVTSDLHGNMPKIDKEFDILFICGDVCPAHDHYRNFQDEWIRNEFIEWINQLPYKDENSKVIMVPGNHDFILEYYKKKDITVLQEKSNGRLVLLKNENYTYNKGDESVKVFGTPYCKRFYNWAFMVDDLTKMGMYYNECEDDVDFFISHDSPTTSGLGLINEGRQEGVDAGNLILAEVVKQKKPRMFFSGHIHSGNHEVVEDNGTLMANVSYINEGYYPVYDLLSFDYDTEARNAENIEKIKAECQIYY